MSFVITHPEALTYAAGKLQTLGSAMAAENAATAAPTTGLIPAGADEVSGLQAAVFAAYGSLYQSVSAQAATIHEQFVQTLGASAGSYAATENANAVTTAAADPPSGALANIFNIGAGNWSSAASDLLGMTGGGLLNKPVDEVGQAAGVAARTVGTVPTGASVPTGLGGAPLLAGLGQPAAAMGPAAPPTWAAEAAGPTVSARGVTLAGLAGAAPQSAPAPNIAAGMPAVATSGKAGGLGAPRYGVRPTVMAKS